MDPIAHSCLGALIANSANIQQRKTLWYCVALSNFPDIDIVAWAFPEVPSFFFHRASTTHSLPMAAILALPFGWLLSKLENKSFRFSWSLAFCILASHVLGDWMTSYGTPIWAPLTSSLYALDWISNFNWLPTLLILPALMANNKIARQISWLGLLIFILCSLGLRSVIINRITHAHPALNFAVFPHILYPWKFRAIGSDAASYQAFMVSALTNTMKKTGVFPKTPMSDVIMKSKETSSVRIFLKHNRWPVVKTQEINHQGNKQIIWGNLLYSHNLKTLHGRTVVELNADGQILRHWRDLQTW